MKKWVLPLLAALLVSTIGWAAVETDPSGTAVATPELRTKLRAAITGGPSISSGTDLLSSGLTVSNPGGTKFTAEVQLATGSTLSVYVTRTVASVTTSTSVVLNGGTALTAGAQTVVSWIGVPNETYNLRLGTTSAVTRLVVVESWGGNTISVASRPSGSSGGGSSDPALGGSLGGTASAATVLALDGTAGHVAGPAGVDLQIDAASGYGIKINGGGGGSFVALRDGSTNSVLAQSGSVSLTAASGSDGSINLSPDGTGKVNLTKQLTWTTGGGGIYHVLGPTDAALGIASGASRNVNVSPGADFTVSVGSGQKHVFNVDGSEVFRLSATGALVTGTLSVPGSGNLSEHFGVGSHAGGSGSVVAGSNATDNDFSGAVLSGYATQALGADTTAVGQGASGGVATTVVGATSSGAGNTSGVGYGLVLTHVGSFGIGRGATSTKVNQGVFGSAGVPIDELRVVGTNGAWTLGSNGSTGYVYRLPLAYASATTVTLGAGNCRSALDDANIVVTATQTLDITATGSDGLDTLTSARTFTTAGTATVTASASIWGVDLSPYYRNLTGTVATSTTTLTGTGTLFLSELALGDVVYVVGKGAARVTAVASDTAATLVAALPDGDASAGSQARCYENLTFQVGSETARRINTINDAGTTIVESGAAAGSTAGQAGVWGVETTSEWLAVYAATISSNGRGFLSTQRTTPYTISGLTAYRRVGWVRNDSSGDLLKFTQAGSGPERTYRYVDDGAGAPFRVLSGGTATSWTSVDVSAVVPPHASSRAQGISNTSGAVLSMGPITLDSSGTRAPFFASNGAWGSIDPIPVYGSQVIRYSMDGAGNGSIDVGGFMDGL